MTTLRAFLARLKAPLLANHSERDLALELEAHIQMLTDDNIRAGVPPDEARRQARLVLGGLASLEEACRDRREFRFLRSLAQDVRYGLRLMRRAPVFTAVAVLSLALGIGVTTAIFTLINAILLKSLPVRDPGALVVLGDGQTSGAGAAEIGQSFSLYSFDLYKHLRDLNVFDGLCAAQSGDTLVSLQGAGVGESQPAATKLVSGNYFAVLGVNAIQGRMIAPADDSPGAASVAVVSFRFWKDHLHGDPAIIGSTVKLNLVSATIIGVAPPGFYGETLQPDPPGFWLPLAANRKLDPQRILIDAPDLHWLYLLGRSKPGVSRTQTQNRLTAALQNWLLARKGPGLRPALRTTILKTWVQLTPGGAGIAHMQQYYSETLWFLLALSGLVLLITCVNIANLLLARGVARRNESTVRVALGASRIRLLQQSFTESLMLALTGGLLGVLLASFSTKLLLAVAFRGMGYIPLATSPDLRVLAFAFVLSCVTAIAFGLLPALRISARLAPAIRSASAGIAGSSPRPRFGLANTLIVAQLALSLVVLAGAGSLARTLGNLNNQHFGFDRRHVLVVTVDAAHAGYQYSRLEPLYRQLETRLNALPGVESASLSNYSPFNHCCWGFSIAVDGYIPKPGEPRGALLNRVSPLFFETMGTRVLEGRAIDSRDAPGQRRVAVITQAFVRRFFPNQSPLGKRIGIGDDEKGHGDIEIVGVVEDAKYDDVGSKPPAMAFLPLLQIQPAASGDSVSGEDYSNFIRTIELRATGDPAALAGQVRKALAQIDPNLPVLRVDTLSRDIDLMLNQQNVVSGLASFFGLLALALTCIGLYGLTAWMVQRRTSEIGVRIALGARRGRVIRMIVREVLVQCAIGILIGVPCAFAALRLIESQLYDVSPADPKDSALAALLLLASVTLAGYLPALRAARIEPIAALRYE